MTGTDTPINAELKWIGQAENWKISRDANDINGLHFLKLS